LSWNLCFFEVPGLNSDAKQLGRIIRCANSCNNYVTINIFQPPAPEDNIASLSHSYLEGTVQLIQTSRTVDVDPRNIIEVSFVISYVKLLDDSNFLEVTGMELVRVLHGRLHSGYFKEIFTPNFPSKVNFHRMLYSPTTLFQIR
jgi:hypothetical protein